MTRRRKEVGVRLKRGKYQVFARINGTFRSVQMDATSTPGERAAERERLIEHWGGVPITAGSIAADVETYLAKPKIAAMPSLKARAAHLALWVAALGPDRPRASITRDEVEAVLQTWLRTMAPGTIYLRRAALQSLYTVLDGADARNPVRGTTRPHLGDPIDRSLVFSRIEDIIAAMPTDRWLGKGIHCPSASRLRVAVIAHTGIPPQELRKLRAHDFDRETGTIRMPRRHKGAGVAPHVRELSPEGIAAFVALDAARAWGTFGRNALTRAFKRAARAVLGPETPVRLYDLRHSLGADLYRQTRDIATVGRLLGHAEGSVVTLRYAKGAHAEVDRAALAAMSATRRHPLPKVPKKLPARRKRQHLKVLASGM